MNGLIDGETADGTQTMLACRVRAPAAWHGIPLSTLATLSQRMRVDRCIKYMSIKLKVHLTLL